MNKLQPLKSFTLKALILGLLSIETLLAAASSPPTTDNPDALRPNILLIFSDDHGAADAGSYGNKTVLTPNLDRLANEGMQFNHAYAAEAICSPSRSSTYTGLYPMRHGAHRNHTQVKPGTQSLPHYLEALDYEVYLAGKTHIGPSKAFPFRQISKSNNPFSDSDSMISAYFSGISSVFNNSNDKPFMLVVATSLPHTLFNFAGGYPSTELYDPATLKLPGYLVDTAETRRDRAGYYELISRLDKDIGTLLEQLEQSTAAENTVVIYSSDHGSGFAFEKWTNYEAGLRVPMIVRWPGVVTAGQQTDALTSLVDLLPTFIDIAGGSAPIHLDGKSLLPLLTGKAKHHHQQVFGTHTTLGIRNASDAMPSRTVRDQRYRYIHNLNPEGKFTNNVTVKGQGGWASWLEQSKTNDFAKQRVTLYQQRPEEELYDLTNDPYELHNLAGKPELRQQQQRLRAALDEWMLQQGDLGLDAPITDKNVGWWRSLLIALYSAWNWLINCFA